MMSQPGKQPKAKTSGLMVVTCILVAVAVLISIIGLLMAFGNSQKLNALQDESAVVETEPQEQTEPTEAPVLSLAQQDLKVKVSFNPKNKDSGVTLEAQGCSGVQVIPTVRVSSIANPVSAAATRYEVEIAYTEEEKTETMYLDLRSSDREKEAVALLDPEDEKKLTREDLSAFAYKLPQLLGTPEEEGVMLSAIFDSKGNEIDVNKYSQEGKLTPAATLMGEDGTGYLVIYADFLKAVVEGEELETNAYFTYTFTFTNQEGGSLTLELSDISYQNITQD